VDKVPELEGHRITSNVFAIDFLASGPAAQLMECSLKHADTNALFAPRTRGADL
jgi:hypothetical protein